MARIRFNAVVHQWPLLLGSNETRSATGPWTPAAPSYYDNPTRIYRGLAGTRDYVHKGPPYHEGGPFDLLTYFDEIESLRSYGTYHGYIAGQQRYRYTGGFTCNWYPTGYEGDPPFTQLNMRKEAEEFNSPLSGYWDVYPYGATGWKRFRPGNPAVNMGTFLGELREVPRMLHDTAKQLHELWRSLGGSLHGFYPKAVAEKWLNGNFGWLPFVNDLRKFYRTQQRLQNMYQYMFNNNGHWVHRGGIVDSYHDTKVIAESSNATLHRPILNTYFLAGSTGSYRITRTLTRKIWFEGRFRFYIPDIGSVNWGRRATAQIFGVYPAPSIVYSLTPWSWLFDWCTNMGDVISNMSDGWAENLAAKYAYIMGTHQYEYNATSYYNLIDGPLVDQWSFPVTRKARLGASPFGFSPSDFNFSIRQWSLLSALGIDKFWRGIR